MSTLDEVVKELDEAVNSKQLDKVIEYYELKFHAFLPTSILAINDMRSILVLANEGLVL